MKKIKRVLLKLSGEALASGKGVGFSEKFVKELCGELKTLVKKNYEIGIVVGGGNYFRGKDKVIDRPSADKVGMLATIMNALILEGYLKKANVKASVMNSFSIDKVAPLVDISKAKEKLTKKEIVIFSGGTSNPFFTTDSTAVLRALEIDADIILAAKNVDGVYDSDPKKSKNAKRFTKLTFKDVLEKDLQVMDMASIAMAKEHNIPIKVFKLVKGNILKAVSSDIGTFIS